MEKKSPSRTTRVAIVGTGLAGLTTAYCLNNDEQRLYSVTLFEQGERPALDAASVTLRDEADAPGRTRRVDLPMRAFAGGYYRNLTALYDHLGVPYRPQRFLFAFSRVPELGLGAVGRPRFVHSSNNHRLPPVPPHHHQRDEVGAMLRWALETVILLVCYVWLTACFFLVRPHPDETLGDFLDRVWLPRYFVDGYVVPLMSSVATCSHGEMLGFPASDVAAYKLRSHGAEHFVVADGVNAVQAALLSGGQSTVCMRRRVVKVLPQPQQGGSGGRVKLRWQDLDSDSDSGAAAGILGEGEDEFDRVVLAVSPDVVARIFEPLRSAMSKMPTRLVESAVLLPASPSAAAAPRLSVVKEDDHQPPTTTRIQKKAELLREAEADIISLQTCVSTKRGDTFTESLHTVVGCGVVVRTAEPDTWRGGNSSKESWQVLRRVVFPRVLRTPESRRIVNQIMGTTKTTRGDGATESKEKQLLAWRNGNNNVWLTGGWCWDGMVLLEGCVVSALKVARDFGVRVPWEPEDR